MINEFHQTVFPVYDNDTICLKFDCLYANNATETTPILRLVREGLRAITHYSTDEVDSFTTVNTLPDMAVFGSARAGIFTMNEARDAEKIKTAFDYFRVEW